MYLKRLQIQGFKTFAQKSEFLYDTGITAIVGPNGSGKSNIADAIRWVLGEQRYSSLRGRKTEDVIFAGSAMKAPMGFAEASITFDNSDRLLPLDFNEVTITRRAYRSGENEYYINKSRVRLKDVIEAVTPLSQTYTVITQGMVDAALSQKPEERRGLFEDAASIGLYNLKKTEAENSLSKQQDNVRHITAMVAEIEPRLKTLERHARQAQEYYTLRDELQILLKRFYGDRWRKLQTHLHEAKKQESLANLRLDNARRELETAQSEMSESRHIQSQKRVALAELHRRSSDLHNRARSLQQQVAVDQERMNGLLRQREGLEQDCVNLNVQLENNQKRLAEVEQEHNALVQEGQSDGGRVAAQEAVVREYATQQTNAEKNLERHRQEVARQQSRLDNIRQRFSQLAERRTQLIAQQEQYLQNRQGVLDRQAEIEGEIATLEALRAGLDEELFRLNERRKAADAELTAATDAIRQSERAAQEARAKRDSAKSRLELLNRLQTSFAGLYGGVKAVMQASSNQQPKLSGVHGLVSNLLQAPADLEVAIEVALGGHLQDIIVEKFEDAERAINLLKTSGAGRATLLPLDNLRSGNPLNPGRALNLPGVRGVASDLVQYEEKYRPVYEQLLGRILVVENMQTGRTALREAGGGWTAVTLDGEILRAGGAVTGGASGKEKDRAEGSILMRERELRELPAEIARLEKQIANHATALSQAQAKQAAARQQIAEIEREVKGVTSQQTGQRDKIGALRGQIDRLNSELRVREENQRGVTQELANLDETNTRLIAEQTEVSETREKLQSQTPDLENAVATAASAALVEREKLTTLRTTAALAEQRLKNSQSAVNFARAEVERAKAGLQTRRQNLTDLQNQVAMLQTNLTGVQHDLSEFSRQIEALVADIKPLEDELAELEHAQAEHEENWRDLSSHLLSLEGAHGRAVLETQRLTDEIETLRRRAADDLAPTLQDDGSVMEDNAAQITEINPAEWEELLALTDKEAVQLAERVESLRGKLRRIGAVNPLAVQEFTETSKRYEFLTGQLQDLEKTSAALRGLIEHLDRITQEKFGETFNKVATAFHKYFGLLFNGGTAKLTLTRPDNLAETGIEILAQPPGKKQQNLSLLSGGERSLTAVALLFALLEVNPTPFCVLDEVDAALDEANVGRFCETLRLLAKNTQFLVVTHNRGTIEAARTIYGISMGADSVSRIMSLRVDEVTDFKTHGARLKKAAPVAVSPQLTLEPALN
jgi:chromosome segregation protein